MNQLERAARALHAARDNANDVPVHPWEDISPFRQKAYLQQTRAVIASIEPDDAMVDVMIEAAHDNYLFGHNDESSLRFAFRATFKAGLRALLAEGEGR